MPNDKLVDEQGRLAALARYDILDTPSEGAFDTITNLVRTALGVPMAAVSFVASDRQWFKSHPGLDSEETAREFAFCDHTIRDIVPMIVSDAAADARFCDNPLVTGDPQISAYAGVPLKTPDGYNIGSLCAIDTRPRGFEPGQIELLQGLAAVVVEQLELRNLAERDSLTGALTRRAFVADVDKKIGLFARRQRPASIAMFDIDHFKRINDTHGHAAGDQVIKAVVDLCSATKRPSDTLGRLGGEEFALLLPETDEVEAASAAQRYCDAIADLVIQAQVPVSVTASFGVAEIAPDRMTSVWWLTAADAALYEAKRSGRNRVCVSPTQMLRRA